MQSSIIDAATILSPLPPNLSPGLTAIAFFGLLSAILTPSLLVHLTPKLIKRRDAVLFENQVLWLIFNLICADCLQAVGFLLNITWLQHDAIDPHRFECWAQAWLLSIGNVASGVFTLSIACQTFADLACDYRLTQTGFIASLVGLWTFVYAIAVIGVASHETDFYARAGAWCWINAKYELDRLYLHYIWITVTEFSTMLMYGILFCILQRGRIHASYHAIPGSATRARRAARAIILYPLVYIICTLPIVIVRISSMAGRPVGFIQQCVAGAMVASTGWLDVLMYCLTRHALIFGDGGGDRAGTDVEVTGDSRRGMGVLETFDWGPEEFGTRTIIEAVPTHLRHGEAIVLSPHRRLSGLVELSAHNGLEDVHPSAIRMVITTHTEVQIRTDGIFQRGAQTASVN